MANKHLAIILYKPCIVLQIQFVVGVFLWISCTMSLKFFLTGKNNFLYEIYYQIISGNHD